MQRCDVGDYTEGDLGSNGDFHNLGRDSERTFLSSRVGDTRHFQLTIANLQLSRTRENIGFFAYRSDTMPLSFPANPDFI